MAKQTTKTTKSIVKQETVKNKKSKNVDIESLSKIYDRDYFENGIATKKSNYVDYSWNRLGSYFQKTAKHIVDKFSPKSVLDVGCAKGYLVKSLIELGVDAKGIDPSEYALSGAHEDVKSKLTSGVVQSIPFDDNTFDVVTCFDVMEHIPEADIDIALSEMIRVSKQWVVLRLVTKELPDDIDKNHATIHDKEWWIDKIQKVGGIVNQTENYVNNSVWWFNIHEFLIVVRKA